MNYTIKLVYMDGKDLSIEMDSSRLDEFYKCLGNGTIFWIAKEENGFWTNIDTIRYVQILQINKNVNTDDDGEGEPKILEIEKILDDAGKQEKAQ